MARGSLWMCGVCVAVLATATLTGCGRHLEVSDWRQSAEQYVYEQANGDLAALGDVQQRGGHRVFKSLGHADPAQGQDVVGVLAGQEVVAGRPWMFFVVGEVRDRELRSSRLVAVTQSEGRLVWATGPAREQPTRAYVRSQLARHGGSAPYEGWPEEGDRYRLRIDGSRAMVTEQRSGATWSVHLDQNAVTGTPSPEAVAGPASRSSTPSPTRR